LKSQKIRSRGGECIVKRSDSKFKESWGLTMHWMYFSCWNKSGDTVILGKFRQYWLKKSCEKTKHGRSEQSWRVLMWTCCRTMS
jgi:predicted transcriptional regulator